MIFRYLTTGLGLALLISFAYFNIKISGLKGSINRLNTRLTTKSAELQGCSAAMDVQTMQIKLVRVQREEAQARYEKVKGLPAKVQYKTIYRDIIRDVNVTRGGCEDVQDVINNVRIVGYDEL